MCRVWKQQWDGIITNLNCNKRKSSFCEIRQKIEAPRAAFEKTFATKRESVYQKWNWYRIQHHSRIRAFFFGCCCRRLSTLCKCCHRWGKRLLYRNRIPQYHGTVLGRRGGKRKPFRNQFTMKRLVQRLEPSRILCRQLLSWEGLSFYSGKRVISQAWKTLLLVLVRLCSGV